MVLWKTPIFAILKSTCRGRGKAQLCNSVSAYLENVVWHKREYFRCIVLFVSTLVILEITPNMNSCVLKQTIPSDGVIVQKAEGKATLYLCSGERINYFSVYVIFIKFHLINFFIRRLFPGIFYPRMLRISSVLNASRNFPFVAPGA
uniref:Secreted protein n=1 Tax=Ascaris lumbricoides TaxID=6252 RepID=A0A0M3HF60_ASCLU